MLLFWAGWRWTPAAEPQPKAEAQPKLSIVVEGVSKDLRENILLHLGISEGPAPPEPRLRRLLRRAPEEIRLALQALGYFEPKIASDLQRRDGNWHAAFHIEPGPPVRITRLALSVTGPGHDDAVMANLVRQFPLHKGDVLNQGTYEKAKAQWAALAANRGYFDARFQEHRVQVDVGKREATVDLEFATGLRYRFGKVSFRQEKNWYDTAYLQRFVPFKPGASYRARKVLELRTNLENSDQFASVDVDVERDKAGDDLQIPVLVTLRALSKYRLSGGVGYGTDTGPRLTLEWGNRRINHRGHSLSAAIGLSQISQSASLSYLVPLKDPLTEKLEFQAGYKKENTDTSDSRIVSVGVSRTDALPGGWVQSLFVNLQRENFAVGNTRGRSTLILPGGAWSRLKADDQFRPRHGHRFRFEITGTDPVLGSDLHVLRGKVDGKWIFPAGGRGRVLVRGTLGALEVDNFNDLPASLRFFAGGDQSVRGYAYNELGPRDSSGQVIGGRYLIVGSVEYEHRIKDKWSVAAFYDIGNALDSLGGDLKQGPGIGVRWLTPIGPVRVDLASAIDESGHPVRLHVYLGPDL